MLLWLVLGVVVFLVLWHLHQRRLFSPNAFTVPGCAPILGHSKLMKANRGRIFDWILDNFKASKGAPFQIKVLGRPPRIVVADPASAKHVLEDNFGNYERGEEIKMAFGEYVGLQGSFFQTGPEWHRQRKIRSHVFKVDELQGYMSEVFQQHGKTFLNILDKSQGKEIDLQDLFRRYTLETIGSICFGVTFGGLSTEEEGKGGKVSAFVSKFDLVHRIVMHRLTSPFWKIMQHFWFLFKHERVLRQLIADMEAEVYAIIAKRKQEGFSQSRKDLLSLFMSMTDHDGKPYDDVMLRNNSMSFILAGRDTSSTALTWLFWDLHKHPHVLSRVVEEIDSVLQGQSPTYEIIKREMPYLKAVVKECMRLHPPAPSNGRTAATDDVLPDGTQVKAGSVVQISMYALLRQESLWPDASTFNPDRWLSAASEPSPYKYLVFSAGPRSCLGQSMAYLEVEMLAIMILQKFRVVVSPDHPGDYEPLMFLGMRDGLPVRVQRR